MTASLPHRRLGPTNLNVSVLGMGSAPIGNLYRAISDQAARETLESALELGIGYFDTAPYYGLGLSERRLGDAVRGRENVVVSTKVGRILDPAPGADTNAERHGFVSPMPFEPRFDYSYDCILRSHEHSLQRLGLARVDILLIHDIGRETHGARHAAIFAQLTEGRGLEALRRLRDEGLVSAIGVGVNEIQICLDLLERIDLDVLLLAGRYTLLEQGAIDELLPRCLAENVAMVIGGPFNSGILATGSSTAATPRYNYDAAPEAVRERVRRLEAVCVKYQVALPAAALQFPLAHPAVACVIPGFASIEELRAGVDHFHAPIPEDLWTELRREGLIDPRAPIPGPQLQAAQ